MRADVESAHEDEDSTPDVLVLVRAHSFIDAERARSADWPPALACPPSAHASARARRRGGYCGRA